MSDTPTPTGPNSGEPKLDRRERSSSASAVTCKLCGLPLVGVYYEVNGEVLCDGCRQQVEESPEAVPGPGGYLLASQYGLMAGVAGAALCYGLALKFEVLRDVRWVADHPGGGD